MPEETTTAVAPPEAADELEDDRYGDPPADMAEEPPIQLTLYYQVNLGEYQLPSGLMVQAVMYVEETVTYYEQVAPPPPCCCLP